MKKPSVMDDLRCDIQLLKSRQSDEWRLLKAEFLHTYESLKPINILKSTLKEVNASPQIKNRIMGSVAGLTTGLLTRVILPGTWVNPIKIIVSSILQAGATNVVDRHAHIIKVFVGNALDFFAQKRNTQT